MTYKYHSALKHGDDLVEDVEPMERWEFGDCMGIQHDFVKHGLPPEMEQCELIYGECPWPQGFKVFDERAGQETRPYKLFQQATNAMIMRNSKPIFLIVGKILLNALPTPRGFADIKLNKGDVMLAWWNYDYNGPLTTNTDCTWHLGGEFDSIGDFCCGYGEPLFSFLDNDSSQKRRRRQFFIGSDHNGKCIRVLHDRLQARVKSTEDRLFGQ